MSIEQGITALGADCFNGLLYRRELLNDGLTHPGWVVEFTVGDMVIVTERCPTPTQALTVAYKAKTEFETERTKQKNGKSGQKD